MFVARSFSQLQEAVRFGARELLILGKLATQLKDTFDESESQPSESVDSYDFYTELGKGYEIVDFTGNNPQITMTLRRRNGSLHGH